MSLSSTLNRLKQHILSPQVDSQSNKDTFLIMSHAVCFCTQQWGSLKKLFLQICLQLLRGIQNKQTFCRCSGTFHKAWIHPAEHRTAGSAGDWTCLLKATAKTLQSCLRNRHKFCCGNRAKKRTSTVGHFVDNRKRLRCTQMLLHTELPGAAEPRAHIGVNFSTDTLRSYCEEFEPEHRLTPAELKQQTRLWISHLSCWTWQTVLRFICCKRLQEILWAADPALNISMYV